jgi:hypothetical protein
MQPTRTVLLDSDPPSPHLGLNRGCRRPYACASILPGRSRRRRNSRYCGPEHVATRKPRHGAAFVRLLRRAWANSWHL